MNLYSTLAIYYPAGTSIFAPLVETRVAATVTTTKDGVTYTVVPNADPFWDPFAEEPKLYRHNQPELSHHTYLKTSAENYQEIKKSLNGCRRLPYDFTAVMTALVSNEDLEFLTKCTFEECVQSVWAQQGSSKFPDAALKELARHFHSESLRNDLDPTTRTVCREAASDVTFLLLASGCHLGDAGWHLVDRLLDPLKGKHAKYRDALIQQWRAQVEAKKRDISVQQQIHLLLRFDDETRKNKANFLNEIAQTRSLAMPDHDRNWSKPASATTQKCISAKEGAGTAQQPYLVPDHDIRVSTDPQPPSLADQYFTQTLQEHWPPEPHQYTTLEFLKRPAAFRELRKQMEQAQGTGFESQMFASLIKLARYFSLLAQSMNPLLQAQWRPLQATSQRLIFLGFFLRAPAPYEPSENLPLEKLSPQSIPVDLQDTRAALMALWRQDMDSDLVSTQNLVLDLCNRT